MSALRQYALARMGLIAPNDFIKLELEADKTPMQKAKDSWTEWLKAIDDEKDYAYYCNAETIETGDSIADAINDIVRSYDCGMANYIIQAQFNMSLCDRP